MRKRLTAALLVGVLSVFGVACDDTTEGIQEDVEEGTDTLEDETDDLTTS